MAHSWGFTSAGGVLWGLSHAGSSVNLRLKLVREDQEDLSASSLGGGTGAPCGGKN